MTGKGLLYLDVRIESDDLSIPLFVQRGNTRAYRLSFQMRRALSSGGKCQTFEGRSLDYVRCVQDRLLFGQTFGCINRPYSAANILVRYVAGRGVIRGSGRRSGVEASV